MTSRRRRSERLPRTADGGRWIRPAPAASEPRPAQAGWERALLEEARRRVGNLTAEGRRLEDRIHRRWDEAMAGIERRRDEVRTELHARLANVERTCDEARECAASEGQAAGFEAGVAAGRDEGLKIGIAEGRDEGRRLGHQEAFKDARAELARAAAAMTTAAQLLRSDRATLLAEARDDVVSLALAVARRIVRREIAIDDSVVLRAVRGAVDLVFRRGRIVVQVHPADVAYVEGALAEEPRWADEFDAVEISVSGDVDLGSCRLLTEAGEVDLTVETQLEQIEDALRRAAKLPSFAEWDEPAHPEDRPEDRGAPAAAGESSVKPERPRRVGDLP